MPANSSAPIDSAFEEVERRGETLAAVFRILIAATLLAAALALDISGQGSSPILRVSIVYAVVSAVGLAVALTGVTHRYLPYLFVLVDCTAIALSLTILGSMQGMGMAQTISLPLFSLAFVVLIHAALRYRPSLVVFGAVVFVSLLLVLPGQMGMYHDVVMGQLPMGMGQRMPREGMMTASGGTLYLPLAFLMLASVILYYIVLRTRRLARLTLLDGQRVAQLSRFFSPEVANQLVAQDDETVPEGRHQQIAILFIDMRGFTRLSENMTPEALTEMLASFRGRVCQIIFDHGGTVDKFIGDAILAVFGAPDKKDDDAARAVQAVFAVSEGVRHWFEERRRSDKPGTLVGVGAHYGEVFAGIIESGQILELSVIGDAVNVAQRLERLTRKLPSNIVLSAEILNAAGVDPKQLKLVRRANVTIPGHQERATLFHDRIDLPTQQAVRQ